MSVSGTCRPHRFLDRRAPRALDSWRAAEQQLSPGWGTFPFFQDVEESSFRIDWILLSQGVQVLDARINDTRPDGVFPSDHLPVQARVVLPGA